MSETNFYIAGVEVAWADVLLIWWVCWWCFKCSFGGVECYELAWRWSRWLLEWYYLFGVVVVLCRDLMPGGVGVVYVLYVCAATCCACGCLLLSYVV